MSKTPAATAAAPVDKKLLFISNLPDQVSNTTIAEYIWHESKVETENVEVLMKGMPGGHKKTCGLAFVKCKTEDDAITIHKKMDGFILLGRPMIVRPDKFVADNPNYVHQDVVPVAAK